MSSTVRTRPSVRVPASDKLAWREARFQRFCGIITASALLLSFVAISCLNGDVKDVTDNKIPFIQQQLDQIAVR